MAEDPKAPRLAVQRRTHLAADEAWVKEFLRQGDVIQIALCQDGSPHIVPTTYWFDGASTIVFHASPHGRFSEILADGVAAAGSVFQLGRRLPSNAALEFSVQYRCVMVYGTVQPVGELVGRKEALTGLVEKYFPRMRPGHEYRPITDREAERTSVYRLGVESWSGKENWPDAADQIDEWPALPKEWLTGW